MRKSVVEAAALTAILLGGVLAWAQPAGAPLPGAGGAPAGKDDPKDQPAKSKLEEMLEKALKDNPDVRLAAAKLAEAEAELNKARLLVVQKVAAQYQAVEAQKAAVDGAAAELEETKTAYKAATIPQAVVRTAEQKLIDAKAKLASLEAELPYLLGQQAEGTVDARLGVWLDRLEVNPLPDRANAQYLRRYYLDLYGRLPTADELAAGPKAMLGPTADRIRAALDKPFTYDCKEKNLADILRDMNKAFQEANPGLLIKDNTQLGDGVGPALSAHFDRMPFGAALEWVEDSLKSSDAGDFDVVIRDYGPVLVAHDHAPPGAPLLRDYMKRAKAEEKPAAAKVPLGVEGKITAYRADGNVVLSMGSDAGVSVGDEFEAYQPGKTPGTDVNMGPVRVTEVTPKESVAKLVGAFMTIPQEGWRVARIGRGK